MFKTLIVEDNAPFRQSLREMLSERFPTMVVDEAENGEVAMQKVEESPPHLVFIDIKLPDENGLQVTRKIKAGYSQITVVILTSYDLPEYREAADICGADYFFAKGSISREEIMELVKGIRSQLDL